MKESSKPFTFVRPAADDHETGDAARAEQGGIASDNSYSVAPGALGNVMVPLSISTQVRTGEAKEF